MCLAIPAQVVAIHFDTDEATVSLGDIRKRISLALVEGVNLGDYVLVHVGYALEKISEQEAQKTLQLFAELDDSEANNFEATTSEAKAP